MKKKEHEEISDMKPLPSKRMARIEKKKKKMAALLKISKLNEHDRNKKTPQVANDTPNETEPTPKRLCTDQKAKKKEEIPTSEENEPSEDDSSINKTDEFGPSGKPKLSGEEFLKLKKMLREKTIKLRQLPKFTVGEPGEWASISFDPESRAPLFLSDIQHLLLFAILGNYSLYGLPRWCHVEKHSKLVHTNVLIVDTMSLNDYLEHKSSFPFLSSKFSFKLEVLNPTKYKGDIVHDINMVPITSTEMNRYIKYYGSLEEAVSQSNEIFDIARNVFPVEQEVNKYSGDLPQEDKFPRTHLLLSGWQMVEENFPLPIKGLMEHKYVEYVLTKDKYKDVTPLSPMFALDCEMCRTTIGDLELTRVSIVNEKLEAVYDELVKPYNKIVDYLTIYSGITPAMMKDVTKRLEQVQEEIRQLLPDDAILVGQSLSGDMHALKMMHPYIIDTSVIFNITGDRVRKTKLKTLSQEFLNEQIQNNSAGHCSTEDSVACLKLVKLKLSKHIYFGDAVMSDVQLQIRQHPELGSPNYATSLLKQCTSKGKTALVVGLEDIAPRYDYYSYKDGTLKNEEKIKCVSAESNKEVVQVLCDSINQSALNIAHIRLTDSTDLSKSYQDLDSWIKQIYEHSAISSLNIIVFGGKQDCENGCCFIKLKIL